MTLYSPDDQLRIIDNWSLSVTGPELGPDGWSILAGTGHATAGLDYRLSLCLELVLWSTHTRTRQDQAGPGKLDQSGRRGTKPRDG